MDFDNDLLESILDIIEENETKLLVWGIVDVYQTKDEIEQIIDEVSYNWPNKSNLTEINKDIFLLFNELISRNLLFEITENEKNYYRSRMSETVRLLYHLRQMFPKHEKGDEWQNAPTLVSDYRFIRRPRSSPKRSETVLNAMNEINLSTKSSLLKEALDFFLTRNRIEEFKLAKFQVDSTKAIIKSFESNFQSGVLITAGTGSGKTLGFYISALAKIASNLIEIGAKNWTQCIAIYPRTELLKDQFSEIYNEARRLDTYLKSKSSRKIIIGPLFGKVPKNSWTLLNEEFDTPWDKKGNDFICPYLKCPSHGCEGDLLWLLMDIKNNKEKLTCSNCSREIDDDEMILTRDSMIKNPPDILFTTTEMLNQNLSEVKYRKLFGIVLNKLKPQMILLDEVHTYNSSHGAQVAFLIRRLKELIKAKMTFVGLSATLIDGGRFFSRLINIDEHWINLISPKPSEFDTKGSEYLIALKGDPISKSAILSTTIQTNMLLSRMLDSYNSPKSKGFYGQKIFVFTDDMDVTNRLYHQILDSEGRNDFGNEVAGKIPLAQLREPNYSESRKKSGQNWFVPKIIQENLNLKKRVTRVSSQDPGLEKDTDIVVATASLEVGVDDPNVGAVIQHKTPRNIASFLQRKGRGGRSKYMRPWTSVVLSDYGRDRLSYQSYDLLFNPELKIQPIPLESRFIQHVQGVYVLLDYIASILFIRDYTINWSNEKVDVWRDLSFPTKDKKIIERQNLIKNCLIKILSDEDELELFKNFLKKSLDINDEEVVSVLWEHPRPLLTTVIPTAIRRLETNWGIGINQEEEFYVENSPLPEFAPSTLFGELNLPEVSLQLPHENDDNKKDLRKMPILQALNSFAPGKVSRRFGNKKSSDRHWLVPIEENSLSVNLDKQFTTEFLGKWKSVINNKIIEIPIYRPFHIFLTMPQKGITDTSNAFLKWQSNFVNYSGVNIKIPKNTKISSIIKNIETFTNGEQSPIDLRRFSTESHAEIKYKTKDPISKIFTFEKNNNFCGIGFNILVDAIKFKIELPIKELIKNIINDKELLKVIRTSRFFFCVKEELSMPNINNPFLREWLGNVYYTMLIIEALSSKSNLEEANNKIVKGLNTLSFEDLLKNLFQSHFIEKNDENQDEEFNEDKKVDKLRLEIENKLKDENVIHQLSKVAQVLWMDINDDWYQWLEDKYTSTIATATFCAIESLCRDIDTEELILDILPNYNMETRNLDKDFIEREFIISEISPGGLGIIENFINLYSEDPRSFFSSIHSFFFENDSELNDFQLRKVLKELSSSQNNELKISVETFRDFISIHKKEEDIKTIKKNLRNSNYILFHGFVTSLSNRILRPGSSFDTDYLLSKVLDDWDNYEKMLNVEIDSKVISFLNRKNINIDTAVSNLGFSSPSDNIENWRFNVLQSLLWSRGSIIRNQHLEKYSPYQKFVDPERLLFSNLVSQNKAHLNVNIEEDWKQEAIKELETKGQVLLKFNEADKNLIQIFLNFITVNPIQNDYLSVYARLVSIIKIQNSYEVTCEIAEVLQ